MLKYTIKFFKDDYEKFSNFYPVIIHYEGRDYPSVEHAFVAAKSKDEMFRKTISDLPADQAGKAKYKGSNIRLRPNWNIIKYPIMKKLSIQKYSYQE